MSSFVKVEKQGSIAILELNRKPVNSFSMEFLQEINAKLNELENDQECQGLVITSVCFPSIKLFRCKVYVYKLLKNYPKMMLWIGKSSENNFLYGSNNFLHRTSRVGSQNAA